MTDLEADVGEASPDPVVIPIRLPPRPSSNRIARTWLFSVSIGVMLGLRFGVPGAAEWVGAVVGGVAGLLLAAWLHRRSMPSSAALPVITFNGNRVSLPRKATSPKCDWLDVRDVLQIEAVFGGRRGQLLLRTHDKLYVYPLDMLGGPPAAKVIREQLRMRIAKEPDGAALLAKMQSLEETSDRLFKNPPRATNAILLLLFVVFGLASLLGAYQSDKPLDELIVFLRLGASVKALIADGEWFRLITANLIHGGIVHIGFNALALLGLGYIVERLVGTWRFLVIYLISGVTGTLASYWLSKGWLSVGASTSVFGIFLAWAYLSFRFNRKLPAGFAMTRFQWIVLIFNFGLALIPFIDGWGHAGGAVGGLIVAAVMYPNADSFERPWGGRALWSTVAFTLLLVYALGVALAFNTDEHRPINRKRVLEIVLMTKPPQVDRLNEWAWKTAIDGESSTEELEVANELAEKAVEIAEPELASAVLDTLATTEYRLGRHADAIATELKSVKKARPGDSERTVYSSQLHRFFDAYVAAEGRPFGTHTATIAVAADHIEIDTPVGGTWYFGFKSGDEREGLLRVQTAGASLHQKIEVVAPTWMTYRFLGMTSESGEPKARFRKHDRSVNPYP